MIALILGLVIFLGAHSTRMFAERWRSAQIARLGEQRWKGLYALVSAIGFVLLIWGYGQARLAPIIIWTPPSWLRHITLLLTLVSFVLITAAYVPRNRLKAKLGHPMLAGTKVWAFAHLLSNGSLADLLLFGGFLLWAASDFVSARRRDRDAGKTYPAGGVTQDIQVVVIGVIVWLVFALYLHRWLIGVAPFTIT